MPAASYTNDNANTAELPQPATVNTHTAQHKSTASNGIKYNATDLEIGDGSSEDDPPNAREQLNGVSHERPTLITNSSGIKLPFDPEAAANTINHMPVQVSSTPRSQSMVTESAAPGGASSQLNSISSPSTLDQPSTSAPASMLTYNPSAHFDQSVRVEFNGEAAVSWVNPKLEARTGHTGCGIFAIAPIKKDESLIVWTGRILSAEQTLYIMNTDEKHYILQIGESHYQVPLSAHREPADWTNHSCAPTAGFGKNSPICLSAMRDLDIGDEVLFDYGMCETDERLWEPMECACGAVTCRGMITANDYKRPELWDRYEGYWSPHVQKLVDKLRQATKQDTSADSKLHTGAKPPKQLQKQATEQHAPSNGTSSNIKQEAAPIERANSYIVKPSKLQKRHKRESKRAANGTRTDTDVLSSSSSDSEMESDIGECLPEVMGFFDRLLLRLGVVRIKHLPTIYNNTSAR